jgi:hypothetical protein
MLPVGSGRASHRSSRIMKRHISHTAGALVQVVLCCIEDQLRLPRAAGLEIGGGYGRDIVRDVRLKLVISAEALRRAQEHALAGRFALEVTREIRNPLEAVGYLIHLAYQEDDPSAIREHLCQANE